MGETEKNDLLFLYELEELLRSRRRELPEESYTTSLFRKGTGKIAQKVGEEAVEVIIAAMENSEEETIYETADLLYHLLVLLAEKEIPLDRIIRELKRRRGS